MTRKSLITLGLFTTAALATTIVLPLTLTSCSGSTTNNSGAKKSNTTTADQNIKVTVKVTNPSQSNNNNIELLASATASNNISATFNYQWYYRSIDSTNSGSLAFFSSIVNLVTTNTATNSDPFAGWTKIDKATNDKLVIPQNDAQALSRYQFMVYCCESDNQSLWNVSQPISVNISSNTKNDTGSNPSAGKTQGSQSSSSSQSNSSGSSQSSPTHKNSSTSSSNGTTSSSSSQTSTSGNSSHDKTESIPVTTPNNAKFINITNSTNPGNRNLSINDPNLEESFKKSIKSGLYVTHENYLYQDIAKILNPNYIKDNCLNSSMYVSNIRSLGNNKFQIKVRAFSNVSNNYWFKMNSQTGNSISFFITVTFTNGSAK